MTEHPDDEMLAWTREMVADLADPGTNGEEALRALGPTDPEADVLAAMAKMPDNWQRHLVDVAHEIVGELTEGPGAAPSAGRHARQTQDDA